VIVVGLVWVYESAGSSEESTYPINRRDKFFSSHFIDRETGFVVGNKGLLLKSADQGESWQRIALETNESLNAITFAGKKGWIAGGSGLIFHSADGGSSWAKQESGVEDPLMGLHFFDEKRGMVIGGAGVILTTADGGGTWERHPFNWEANLPECAIEMCSLSPILYDMYFLDEKQGWIVGEKGTVMVTRDGGEEWQLLDVGKYSSLYGVYFRDGMNGIAIGKDTTFLTSTDGGVTWTQKVFPPNPMGDIDLYDIEIDGKEGIIVGDRSLVLLSEDGGKGWKPSMELMKPPMPWLVGACVIPENSPKEACIVGAGTVVKLAIGK
jgi:photosystem II stability/assembly factor-like uncharacterized protein